MYDEKKFFTEERFNMSSLSHMEIVEMINIPKIRIKNGGIVGQRQCLLTNSLTYRKLENISLVCFFIENPLINSNFEP
jgi:hypothetical protein